MKGGVMVPIIIITIISGLVMVGLFLKLKRMLKKKKLPYWLPWLRFGLVSCMMMFLLSACVTVMEILENFYSVWIADFAALGITIVLMIVLVKLLDSKFEKIKNLTEAKRSL